MWDLLRLNPCPLHWQADSYPLHHQGSPFPCILLFFFFFPLLRLTVPFLWLLRWKIHEMIQHCTVLRLVNGLSQSSFGPAQKPAFDVDHPGVLRLKFICSGQTSAKRKHFVIFWSSCGYHQVVFSVRGLEA